MWQPFRPKEDLTEQDVELGLRMLLWDAVFAQVMMVLTTGAFLIGYALMFQANNTVIGLLAAVSPFFQTLQLPSIYLVERIRVRRTIAVVGFGASRLALLVLALLPLLKVSPGVSLSLFLIFLSLHHAFAAAGNCAFNSWLRDFVPADRLERFFARRLSIATLAGAVLSFGGGVAIDWIKKSTITNAGTFAYGFLFLIGSVAGLLSVIAISRTPEPQMPPTKVSSLRPLLAEPLTDINFRNLLIFLAVWSFAVNFAAPFFAVYLIDRLGLSMTLILVLSVLSQMANVPFFGIWGRMAERFSNKTVMVFCVPLFFLTFLMWPFTTMPQPHAFTMPILIVIHIVGGIAAAGVGLCAGNLALKSAPYGKGAAYLAVNALISGAAATVAPILAGMAADGFNRYEARILLSLIQRETSETLIQFPMLDLKGIDFLFVLAFIFGIYSAHRLLAVREQGEISEKVLRDAIYAEARRVVRQVSTVAGVRQIVSIPYAPLQVLARRLSGNAS
ncbi:MAG TPA: MFS transporter [Candidatus Hydrogenedentes bacterium]|nr:MFS transporter [Candidatus Hydrogenedentota bacterium]HOL76017.1 MFS transporter [Candidatus Hydrogenedentota bacterium]HPO84631.1 MFS transporter [Candidatus Hydrogenedentota bacterium]